VVGVKTLFTARDFHPRRLALPRHDAGFQGLFASLGDLNYHLAKCRSQRAKIFSKNRASR
jgi:hypothetical protein